MVDELLMEEEGESEQERGEQDLELEHLEGLPPEERLMALRRIERKRALQMKKTRRLMEKSKQELVTKQAEEVLSERIGKKSSLAPEGKLEAVIKNEQPVVSSMAGEYVPPKPGVDFTKITTEEIQNMVFRIKETMYSTQNTPPEELATLSKLYEAIRTKIQEIYDGTYKPEEPRKAIEDLDLTKKIVYDIFTVYKGGGN